MEIQSTGVIPAPSASDAAPRQQMAGADGVASTVMSKDKVVGALEGINERLQLVGRELEFSIDEGTNRVVVKVIDADTQEVIRQIPAEIALALARRLQEEQPFEGAVLNELV